MSFIESIAAQSVSAPTYNFKKFVPGIYETIQGVFIKATPRGERVLNNGQVFKPQTVLHLDVSQIPEDQFLSVLNKTTGEITKQKLEGVIHYGISDSKEDKIAFLRDAKPGDVVTLTYWRDIPSTDPNFSDTMDVKPSICKAAQFAQIVNTFKAKQQPKA